MFEDILQHYKVQWDTLESYGFKKEKDFYRYEYTMDIEGFVLEVVINADASIDTLVLDTHFNEPYTLYKTDAQGEFVGQIRQEVEDVIKDIIQHCFIFQMYQQEQTNRLLKKIEALYGDSIEYLWKRYPNNGIFRRSDTNKWYAAFLTVEKSKLGLDGDDIVEIMDMRYPKEELETLIQQPGYYPGWHMNKKNWYTVVLDDSLSDDTIMELVKISYELAK